MTVYDPGDVVLVRFPFTDLTSSKKRPAVVVSRREFASHHGDVVLVALTSQLGEEPAFQIGQWQQAGLVKPTWVKPLIGTVSIPLITQRLGHLAAADAESVRAALKFVLDDRWTSS